MICPLLACGVLATPDQGKLSMLDLAGEEREERAADRASACLSDACAWWDSRSEHCAVHVLAWAMTETVEAQARRVDRYEESH